MQNNNTVTRNQIGISIIKTGRTITTPPLKSHSNNTATLTIIIIISNDASALMIIIIIIINYATKINSTQLPRV